MLAKNFGRIMRRLENRPSNNNGQYGAPFNRDKATQGYKHGNNYIKGKEDHGYGQ